MRETQVRTLYLSLRRAVLSKFGKHGEWGHFVVWDEIVAPLKGHDAGDHSPITPLVATGRSTFYDGDASRLYAFVVQYFIATVSLSLSPFLSGL